MSEFFYAHIDENNIVRGILSLPEEINLPYYIEIDFYNIDLIGKRWNGSTFETIPEESPGPIMPPGWPEISKFEFRKLLRPENLIVWDNWKEMNLGITQEQTWQLNTFMKSFEFAEKITMTDPMTQQGLLFCVNIGLLTEEDVERILLGQYPD